MQCAARLAMFQFTIIAVLVAAALLQGCVVVPGVEPTDLSSVKEEMATRAEVEAALGEPELFRATDQGRIDVYLIDRGAEDEVHGVGHPGLLPLLPIGWLVAVYQYDEKVDEQEGYLAVIYDKQDRVVENVLLFSAKTSEEAIEMALTGERKIDLTIASPESAEALFQLGRASKFGSVLQFLWYCNAAHKGHPTAQFLLAARFYKSGTEEITRDLQKTYLWYSLAKANGEETSGARLDQLRSEMSLDEIQNAEGLLAAWRPNPSECQEEAGRMKNTTGSL